MQVLRRHSWLALVTDAYEDEEETRGLYPGHLVPPHGGSRDVEMLKCPRDTLGGVSGLEIRCPRLETRLGSGEMQGGSTGEHEQLSTREGEDNCQRGWGCGPEAKGA